MESLHKRTTKYGTSAYIPYLVLLYICKVSLLFRIIYCFICKVSCYSVSFTAVYANVCRPPIRTTAPTWARAGGAPPSRAIRMVFFSKGGEVTSSTEKAFYVTDSLAMLPDRALVRCPRVPARAGQ